MMETPYKYGTMPYRDRFECPSLHVSNDSINWEEIVNNPIDDIDEKGVIDMDYLSDPHLVFAHDKIECWYRLTKRYGDENSRSNVYLLRKTTTNGTDWSEREILLSLKNNHDNGIGNMIVSPSIIFESEKYNLWFVDSENMGKRDVAFASSHNAKKWDNKTICTLHGKNVNPWHIDVAKIEDTYYLTCYDFQDITIYKSKNKTDFYFIKTLLKLSA